MVFERWGFKTGKVILPGLELIVQLHQNKYFRNDGVVMDMDKHTDDALRELGASSHDYKRGTDAFGRHIALSSVGNRASLIFIQDSQNPEVNIFSYGHESTHAVIHLGLESYFLKKIRRMGFTLDPFKRYHDEESIAHVGGLVSVYQINPNIVSLVDHPELNPMLKDLIESKR